MIIASEQHTLGFPSLSVVTENYELEIVPAIGGRIMRFGADGVNLLYQNERLRGKRPTYEAATPEEMQALRKQSGMLLYGGEKTWLAPQSDWIGPPYADLDHGEYTWEAQRSDNALAIVLTSPVCRETQLQIIRTIICRNGERYIDIQQQLINHGDKPAAKGLWQVTMLNRPGEVYIPDGAAPAQAPTQQQQQPVPMLHPDHAKAERDAEGWRITIDDNRLYKLGFTSDAGRAEGANATDNGKTYKLVKTFPTADAADPAQTYPHGTVVEVYNSADYVYYELEVHSPLYTLQPGESAAFNIRWELAVSDV